MLPYRHAQTNIEVPTAAQSIRKAMEKHKTHGRLSTDAIGEAYQESIRETLERVLSIATERAHNSRE